MNFRNIVDLNFLIFQMEGQRIFFSKIYIQLTNFESLSNNRYDVCSHRKFCQKRKYNY